MKKLICILPFLLLMVNLLIAQNCQYGQCAKIKDNGEQCRRCVSYLQSFCNNHQNGFNPSKLFPKDKKEEPTNPGYNLFDTRSDCKFSQCIATKADGNRCRSCTSNTYDIYCSSHK